MNKKAKTVLVAPLDWGLGHATRMCQLIDQFIDEGYVVHLAGSGASIDWLSQRYSSLPVCKISGKAIRYSSSGLSRLASIKLAFDFYYNYRQEKKFAEKCMLYFDIVVSDNRYGLSKLKKNKNQVSIFVTHQLFPRIKTGSRLLNEKIKKVLLGHIRKFDYCLIPDFRGKLNLSGELSHRNVMPERSFYIGPLSRFYNHHPITTASKDFFACVIISGPEPYREVLEKKFKEAFLKTGKKCIIINGQTGKEMMSQLVIHGHPSDDEFISYLLRSEYVISLAGYSSLMDLFVLGIKALVFPTPGQSEQEYFCRYLHHDFFTTFDDPDHVFEYLRNIAK